MDDGTDAKIDQGCADALGMAFASDQLPSLERLFIIDKFTLSGKNPWPAGICKTLLEAFAQGSFPKLEEIHLPLSRMSKEDYHLFADVLDARMLHGCSGLKYDPLASQSCFDSIPLEAH